MSEHEIRAKVNWVNPEQIPIIYANHMFVHLVEGTFLVTFGRAELPFVKGGREMQEAAIEDGVDIVAVGRMAIPGQVMGRFIEILNGIHATWESMQRESLPTPSNEEDKS